LIEYLGMELASWLKIYKLQGLKEVVIWPAL